MAASTPLEVLDMSRMQSLVMPRAPHRPVASLKPIEMATKSIHFQGPRQESVVLSILPACPPVLEPVSLVLQGWVTPVGYAVCGLGMGLCNLISPAHIRDCAHVLTPVWTLALGLHALTQGGDVCAWWGAMTVLLLPFVILVRDPLFVAFYLAAFTGFALARFWVNMQGAQFLLACACCVGVVGGCSWSLAVDQPQAQLSVAAFFSISAGVVGSVRAGKTVLRVG